MVNSQVQHIWHRFLPRHQWKLHLLQHYEANDLLSDDWNKDQCQNMMAIHVNYLWIKETTPSLSHTHTRAHAHTNVMVSTNGYKKEQKFSKSWDSQLCWRKVCKLKCRPLIWSLLHKNLCASKQRCQKSISLQKMTHTENYKDLLQRQKQFYHII